MQQVQTNQLMSRAQQLQQQGNIEGARRLYMQVLAIFPSNLRAQSALSSLNLIAQRNVPSQQQLNALSKLFRQRDFAGVVASTRKLLKDYPKSFLLWNIQGAANLEIKELKEAEFSFKKAVQI